MAEDAAPTLRLVDETMENDCGAVDLAGDPDDDMPADSDNVDTATPDSVGSFGRAALLFSLFAAVAVAALAAWLSVGAYQAHQRAQQRAMFLDAGRQGALDLTTIDCNEPDKAIQRILSSSTGTFHDDFQQRYEPFVQVVKKFQSRSQGMITAAGLESVRNDEASVVVSVSVTTTSAGVSDQPLHLWRMRLKMQRVGNMAKMSEVTFI